MPKTGAKKVVSRVRLPEAGEKVPLTLTWVTFEGSDGAMHCKPVGTAPRHMRTVGKPWRPNRKAVLDMERRRAGRTKKTAEESTPSGTEELITRVDE